MKHNSIKILGLSVLMSFCAQAQDGKVKRADKNFDDYAYMDAINSYEDLVKDGYSDEAIYKRLGNANYLNANYQKASEWYGKLFELEGLTIDPDYYYRYAQTLKSLGAYKQSNEWMEKFISLSNIDGRAAKYASNKDYLKTIKNNSGKYTVETVNFNSKHSDFAPMFYDEGLIFSSARDTGLTSRKIHEWNNESFLNIYKATITDEKVFEVSKLSKELNTKAHESSTTFTADGETMYFTRNNFSKGFSRDDEGVSRLQVFMATLVDGKWQNTVPLPFNSKEYSVAHPTLNQEGTRLYFASDMPGSIGQSDIFYVTIDTKGNFGTPQNLGVDINTEGRETFPFLSKENILYFSSDGHPGLGGLDVFATDSEKADGTNTVINLGEPINTKEDDFSFIVDTDKNQGYFASNRSGGMGNDDIYSFKELKAPSFVCTTDITGVVKNQEDGAILSNTDVQFLNDSGEELAKTVSDENGRFALTIDCTTEKLTAIAVKTDYKEGKTTFVAENDTNTINLDLVPSKMMAGLGDDLVKNLEMPTIYFDFDKDVIRQDAQQEIKKVLKYMSEYPGMKLDIKSHTDSRGDDDYNYALSEKRAQSTKAFLITKGVDARRLSAKGYGKNELINSCDNGSSCSKAQHERNRRTEFIIVQ